MYSPSYSSYSSSYCSPGLARPGHGYYVPSYTTGSYSSQYRTADYSPYCPAPTRGVTAPPPGLPALPAPTARHRTALRLTSARRETTAASPDRHLRLRSPSIPRETTRDELIDSIVHTRTREHRPLPGFKSASDYDERRSLRVDCDKVYPGIIIGNGDTICNINYLKGIGVTHVLNTAEHHVEVNPAKYSCYGLQYYGFHVDDLPDANISRHFHSTTAFIDRAVRGGGLVVVNCVMGWSRSAVTVAAYLIMKHNMKATKALELIRQNRNIRPNAGFLQQLADLENTLSKREHW